MNSIALSHFVHKGISARLIATMDQRTWVSMSVVSQPESTDPLEKIMCLLIAHISAMESFTDVIRPELDTKSI